MMFNINIKKWKHLEGAEYEELNFEILQFLKPDIFVDIGDWDAASRSVRFQMNVQKEDAMPPPTPTPTHRSEPGIVLFDVIIHLFHFDSKNKLFSFENKNFHIRILFGIHI